MWVAPLLVVAACTGQGSGSSSPASTTTSYPPTSVCSIVPRTTLEELVGSPTAAEPYEQHDAVEGRARSVCRYGWHEEIGINVERFDDRVDLAAFEAARAARPAGEAVPVEGIGDSAWYSESGMYLAVHTPSGTELTVRAVMWDSNPKRAKVGEWLRLLATVAVAEDARVR